MPVLSLIARMSLDKSDFDRKLSASSSNVSKFGSDASKKLGKAFTGGAVVAALLSIGRQAIESGRDIDEMAKKLGVSAEEAQRLKLKDSLRSDAGSFISLNDDDLERLRLLDRLMLKVRQTVTVIAGKMIGAFGSPWRLLGDLGKATGFVSGDKPNIESDAERDARMRHMAEQERILQLEKETLDINEKTRISKLTEAQRLNELLKERTVLMENLKDETQDDAGLFQEGYYMMQRRLAEVNSEIAGIGNKSKPPSILKNELGSIGAFTGANAGAPQWAQHQNRTLERILETLRSRGIKVDVGGVR